MQLALMDDRVHLSRLEKAGNIGVALGKVSSCLVSIDIDQDDRAQEFLGLNPALSDTLRTKGARGCNVWARMKGDYPPTHKLKDQSGTEIGEFRSDGSQTIIYGTHPNGSTCTFQVEKPAVTISYGDITFFTKTGDFSTSTVTPLRRLRDPEDLEDPETQKTKRDGRGLVVVENKLSPALRELITGITPKDVHQNHNSLFLLARLCRTAENSVRRRLTHQELEIVFDCWCDRSRPFWRPQLSRDEYMIEFQRLLTYAKIGLDEGPLQLAYARARARPLPDVPLVKDERIRLLAGMFRELSEIAGGGEFYLPTRKLGQLLGISHVSANSWIGGLRALGFIKRTSPGNAHRSPRYVYIHQIHAIPR